MGCKKKRSPLSQHRSKKLVVSDMWRQTNTALRWYPPGYPDSELMTPRSPGRYSPRSCFCSKRPFAFNFLLNVFCNVEGNRHFPFYVSYRAQLWGDTHPATQTASLWLPGHRVDIHLEAAFAPNVHELSISDKAYFASFIQAGSFLFMCFASINFKAVLILVYISDMIFIYTLAELLNCLASKLMTSRSPGRYCPRSCCSSKHRSSFDFITSYPSLSVYSRKMILPFILTISSPALRQYQTGCLARKLMTSRSPGRY